MFVINKLSGFVAVLLVLCLVLPAPVWAKTRKGNKFYKEAQKAELAKDWDLAFSLYEKALQTDPGEMFYRTSMYRARFEAGQQHVDKGIQLRTGGQLETALAEFQRAFAIDPSSSIALQEIKITTAMIDKAKQGSGGGETPRGAAAKMEDERISSLLAPPELKPIEGRIKNLKMNNQPVRVLYETVGALAGINVILDPNFQNMGGKNANVDLSNASLEEALDYIALQTHTFWKPVNSNTIFVAEENPTKRRDYEDQVVKVFYLKNTTSPQEFTEILNTVRSVTDIRRMFPYAAQSAAVVRGTPDQIAIAEKLFHDLDKAKAEVVVDIVIMSTDSTRTRNIASALNSAGGGGLNLPIGFTPRSSITVSNNNNNSNGTGTPGSPNNNNNNNNGNNNNNNNGGNGSSVALSNIFKISSRDFSVSLPGALLQAMLEDSSTRVMQSPQVRASDGMKVTLKVGQKYPYATGSYQPGVGSVGLNPLVNTQFQFLDTGVDLEVTPHVHGSEDVTLHVDIKLSNVQSTISLGGVSQPIVAQQTNATDVRLRDGQVALLGGIVSSNNTSDVTGIPGIMNIPALGQYLGATNNKKRVNDELIIALVPHIVRLPDLQEADFRGIYTGTEVTPRVIRAPEAENKPAPAATASPATPAPAAPGAQPTPAAPAQTSPAASPKPPGAPPAANSAALKLTFQPADVHVKTGAPVALVLQAENANDLFSAPVKIKWDPALLRLDAANPGPLVTQGGQSMRTPTAIHNDTGEATLNLSRIPGSGGISGTGSLATLNFVPLRKGSGKVSISEVDAKNSRLEQIEATKPEIVINVE